MRKNISLPFTVSFCRLDFRLSFFGSSHRRIELVPVNGFSVPHFYFLSIWEMKFIISLSTKRNKTDAHNKFVIIDKIIQFDWSQLVIYFAFLLHQIAPIDWIAQTDDSSITFYLDKAEFCFLFELFFLLSLFFSVFSSFSFHQLHVPHAKCVYCTWFSVCTDQNYSWDFFELDLLFVWKNVVSHLPVANIDFGFVAITNSILFNRIHI